MKIEIDAFVAYSLVNIGIICLVASALYITKEPWCLLGLVFLRNLTNGNNLDV
uniref:Uncharacterized protein n=1 Tax=viral metagenome TaxID=1070528 RepID=A0A6M3X4G6_9ZZZZ